jgi:hypothetical protein
VLDTVAKIKAVVAAERLPAGTENNETARSRHRAAFLL